MYNLMELENMMEAKSIPVMLFREAKENFKFEGVKVQWYESNFGGWFMRAQDIALLCQVPMKKARAIYEEIIPPELQTKYCSIEVATVFLRALRDLSEGRSFKIWQGIRDEFTDDPVETKFDTPIIPWIENGVFLPAINVTLLNKLGGVKVMAGTGVDLELKKGESHRIIPLLKLVTNDSQVQHMIQGILDYDEDKMIPRAYKRIVNRARKSRLVIHEIQTMPTHKGSALKRDNAELEAEVARLRGLLTAANIDPDQPAIEKLEGATLHTMDGKQDEHLRKACAVIKSLINEHYPLLFAQAQLLRGVSEDLGKRDKSWDHKRFMNSFNNARILNLLSDIQTKCNRSLEENPDIKITEIEQVVRQNLGRYSKGVYEVLCLAREFKGSEMDKLPRAA